MRAWWLAEAWAALGADGHASTICGTSGEGRLDRSWSWQDAGRLCYAVQMLRGVLCVQWKDERAVQRRRQVVCDLTAEAEQPAWTVRQRRPEDVG